MSQDQDQDQGAAGPLSRTRFMQERGFRVRRFCNNDVLTQTDRVREQLLLALQAGPHPNPFPPAGEGARQDTRNHKP